MKALIIDDERHVREAIKLLVPWEQFGIQSVHEATDGLTAIELIEAERPAVIFTDMMMPGMDGMALLEWTASYAPNSKIIVISGHDDFAFVRQTLKYGGLDYLLKPIEQSQLHGALGKAIESWKSDERARSTERSRNIEINRLKPVYLDQWFSNLISETSEHHTVHSMLEQQFGVVGPIKEAIVGIVSLELTPPSIQSKFSSCWDLLYYSLANICNEFLRARNAGYAFRYRGQDNEIVIVLWDGLDKAIELLHEINEGIGKSLKARFGIGVGEKAVFPENLDVSYRSARRSIRHRNLLSTDTNVQGEPGQRTDNGTAMNGIYFKEHEQRIRYALLSGDKEQLANAYTAWFTSIEQADVVTLEQLHLWWQEFKLARRMWTNESAKASPNRHESDEPRMPPFLSESLRFDAKRWQQGFLSESEKIMAELSSNPDRSRSTMQAIADYVEQFIHEELSLQDISSRFYLSREYISRKFKQEMNENLTDYITRVRVERAKQLLADTPLRISVIAERVGFQDEKYFSKVFKKWTDQAPNEYRKFAFGDNRGK